MSVKKLSNLVRTQRNFLCVGLDPDLDNIPSHFSRDAAGVVSFIEATIDATKDHCVAYKVNFAFFEALGKTGWYALDECRKRLPNSHFLIADAKRGDIGNTANKYAEAIFGELDFDAVTLSPYMGKDVVEPFLEYKNKTSILLALTSNPGSCDFQLSKLADGRFAFEEVLQKSATWGTTKNMMYVVGATNPEYFSVVRRSVPDHYLLVPGVGAQGGDLAEVFLAGANADVGLLINSSRGILYAGDGPDFAAASANKAKMMALQMSGLLKKW